MRNTFITERDGQWIVTLVELGETRRQQYFCATLAIAKRWALLLSGVPRAGDRPVNRQPAA